MGPTLKAIVKLLPPPASPRGLNRSWKLVEREIGLALPDDYKAFIDLYGSGRIASADGWADVWNFRDASIFGPSLHEALSDDKSVAQFYRRRINTTDYACPHPIYPEPGGLLPFASVDDVQYLNWLTKGSANRWDVVYFFFDGLEFTRLQGDSFSRCLLKMLRKDYTGMGQPPTLELPFVFTDQG